MKTMKHSLVYVLISAALVTGLVSLTAEPDKQEKQEPAPDAPKHIRVQIDYIEMPLGTMSALLDDEQATKTDSILRKRVGDLIKKGDAKLIEIQLGIVRSGEKASVESIREFIYPTEYEPSELPNEVHVHIDGKDKKIPGHDFATGPTPTAFETRNLGSTLEIEATMVGQYINLRFAPELVYHIKNTVYAEWKGKHGRADVVMPEMYTLRTNTNATLTDGKPTFVCALSPKSENGKVDYSRKILMFAKANIITAQ